MQIEMIKTEAKGCKRFLAVFILPASVDVIEFQTEICMGGSEKGLDS
jgi:putative effector of murein hydrolase LrgA (UPF0299 family)